jgi:N-formylglutamate deformylase
MSVVEIHRGPSPVILGFPHTGTDVPGVIWNQLNDNGRIMADTDWHIHRLYEGLLPNATTVRATFHRYVIDANRDPSGGSLYPGQNTTGLIPETDFDGKPIWREGASPTENDIAQRVEDFHSPYHTAIASEIARVKTIHGIVVLYDCHSIRSHIPFLFKGKLPDLNVGTNDGSSCDPSIESAAMEVTRSASGFTSVLNGRFKGGFTTRHFGNPATGVHAIQMELAQCTHLASESPPFAYDEAKAEKLRLHLEELLQRIEKISLSLRKM